jgi:hypothetical protein
MRTALRREGQEEMRMAARNVTIEIFDPPMCCPSGVCGPTIDPALLDFHEAILKLRKEHDGQLGIERYVLSQQPAKFMQQPEVIARLKTVGIPALPITVVNGRLVKERAYPSYTELQTWIAEG